MSRRSKLGRLLALCASALLVTAAAAAESPPPVGPPRPFTLPSSRDIRLGNGFVATLVASGTVPKVTVALVLRAGNIDDAAQTGLADVAANLLKEGAGRYDAAQLARLAADMGGALEVAAGPDQTTLSMDVLSERATDAIALLADIARRPHLPAGELARLKADLGRQTAIARSQPQGLAGDAFARLLWGEHPYGRVLPTDAGIASITIDSVRTFIANNYGAGRAHLFIAGLFDAAAAERAIQQQFANWATGRPLAAPQATGSRARIVMLIDRPGAAQSTVLLGLPVPPPVTPGFMRLSIANALLGGSLLSRLNQNLREDKGWTYGVRTQITPYAGGAATWALSADINAPDTAPAIAEIFTELGRMRTAAPPAEELRGTQNYRAGTFVIGASGRAGLIAQLAFADLQGLSQDWLTNYGAHVYAVTPNDVREAAASYLDPNAMTMVVVGDMTKLKAAIVALPALHGATFQ